MKYLAFGKRQIYPLMLQCWVWSKNLKRWNIFRKITENSTINYVRTIRAWHIPWGKDYSKVKRILLLQKGSFFQFYQFSVKLYFKFHESWSKRSNPKWPWLFSSKLFGSKFLIFLDNLNIHCWYPNLKHNKCNWNFGLY